MKRTTFFKRTLFFRWPGLLIFLLLFPGAISASRNDSAVSFPLIHHLDFTTGFDYVASSVEDEIRGKIPSDEKIKSHTALPFNLKYSFSFTNPSLPHYLPGGYQGIGIGGLNIGMGDPGGIARADKYIGYPVLAYLFQGGPFKHFNNGLSLNYEWNFGAAFGWKPYSEANKYFNLTVGSRVNAYLNLNLHLLWQITDHTAIFAGVALSHFSNGNTSFPNPGVNSIGIRAGISYTLNPIRKRSHVLEPDTVKEKKLGYDISIWGGARKRVYKGGEEPVLLPGHFACAGISFSPLVRLNRWWRVGGAADLQWDQSSDMKKNYISGSTTQDIRFNTPSFWRQLTVGLSAHAELQMPIFAVNIGCGYNFVSPWENRGTYQNITLKTFLCKTLFLNIGYQLRNFQQQSSLMLGLGLSL